MRRIMQLRQNRKRMWYTLKGGWQLCTTVQGRNTAIQGCEPAARIHCCIRWHNNTLVKALATAPGNQ